MVSKKILSKYAVYCPDCKKELNTVAFGKEIDKLKCFECNKQFEFIKSTRALNLYYNDDNDKYNKFNEILGEYPGVPTSLVYCPRILKIIFNRL
ncbi:hypothetical protein [Paenibacillus rhizolycopersici]|uniref:hypothetical protein n=1 Tax=Paenibacillus rhizolycopersici TaxID=2780073 RepID=UPI003D26F6FA